MAARAWPPRSPRERAGGASPEADLALERFVGELDDLCAYLEHDLTADGLAQARATIAKAFAHGQALRDQLGALARSSDDARESLTPLQALASSQDGTGVR